MPAMARLCSRRDGLNTMAVKMPMPPTHFVIWGVSGVSWIMLWLWGQTTYAALLDHGNWTQAGLLQSLCADIPGVSQAAALGLSALAWVVMVGGMMLPLSAKVFDQLNDTLRHHPHKTAAIGGFSLGYLIFAIFFGVILHGFGYALGRMASGSTLLTFDGWIIGVAVFGIAGLFQFSRTKTYFEAQSCCLDCGAMQAAPRVPNVVCASLISGLRHGFFCFMCCWALMCLMFVFWTGSFVWMMAISVAMLLERNAPQLRASVGLVLIAAAGTVTSIQLFMA